MTSYVVDCMLSRAYPKRIVLMIPATSGVNRFYLIRYDNPCYMSWRTLTDVNHPDGCSNGSLKTGMTSYVAYYDVS